MTCTAHLHTSGRRARWTTSEGIPCRTLSPIGTAAPIPVPAGNPSAASATHPPWNTRELSLFAARSWYLQLQDDIYNDPALHWSRHPWQKGNLAVANARKVRNRRVKCYFKPTTREMSVHHTPTQFPWVANRQIQECPPVLLQCPLITVLHDNVRLQVEPVLYPYLCRYYLVLHCDNSVYSHLQCPTIVVWDASANPRAKSRQHRFMIRVHCKVATHGALATHHIGVCTGQTNHCFSRCLRIALVTSPLMSNHFHCHAGSLPSSWGMLVVAQQCGTNFTKKFHKHNNTCRWRWLCICCLGSWCFC